MPENTIEMLRLICRIPEHIHPFAQSALEHWVSGWYATSKFGDATLAFAYHATIVQSDNFNWVGCVIKLTTATT